MHARGAVWVDVWLPLAVATTAVAVVWAAGMVRAAWTGWAATGSAIAVLAAVGLAVARGSLPPVTFPWIPEWTLTGSFHLDGLAASYALLTAAVAVMVLTFALPYMRHHVAQHGRPLTDLRGFYVLFVLFVAAMVGLVMSGSLLQLFVFWDLTAICSYLLIAHDWYDRRARRAALSALLVTGIGSLFLLLAAVVLHLHYGTSDVRALSRLAQPDRLTSIASAFIVVAALAKSAQWPLHFWLPRAMVAPTPVSAYLHAAAMVAAGVFILQRLQPLLLAQPAVGPGLAVLGWLSMIAGGLAAIRERELKRILAYSTIAQYGHVVFVIALGGAESAAAATLFVMAHGLCKSALFLSAGAVTIATGETDLGSIGGLKRKLPVLAAATGIAAAGLAGLPLTIGYFKDELLFGSASTEGWARLGLAAVGPALTLAYMWRFWSGLFLGPLRGRVGRLEAAFVAPIGAAALAIVVLGIWPAPLVRLAEAAAAATAGATHVEAGYHADLRPENLAALGALLGGIGLFRARAHVARLARALALAGSHEWPQRLYSAGLVGVMRAAQHLRWNRPRQLRMHLALVLVGAAALVAIGQLSVGIGVPRSKWSPHDVPLAAGLIVTALAAVLTASRTRQLTAVLMLSLTSVSMAAVLAAFGAPDVALVIVIMNVVTTLLLVAVLRRLPNRALEEQRRMPAAGRWSHYALTVVAAALAFLVAWATFARPEPTSWIGAAHLQASLTAHARNAVSAILVDFRGLDTMGEITVVVISVVAVERLIRRREGAA